MADKQDDNRERKPYTITKPRESWTDEEHNRFLEALRLYVRDWKKIERHIATKSVIQIRSHAQKYFLKMQKQGKEEELPPARPKRKPDKPPPKSSGGSSKKVKVTTSTSSQATTAAMNAAAGAPAGVPAEQYLLSLKSFRKDGKMGNISPEQAIPGTAGAASATVAAGGSRVGGIGALANGAGVGGQAPPGIYWPPLSFNNHPRVPGMPTGVPGVAAGLVPGKQKRSKVSKGASKVGAQWGGVTAPVPVAKATDLASQGYVPPALPTGQHAGPKPQHSTVYAFLSDMFNPSKTQADHAENLAKLGAADRAMVEVLLANLSHNLESQKQQGLGAGAIPAASITPANSGVTASSVFPPNPFPIAATAGDYSSLFPSFFLSNSAVPSAPNPANFQYYNPLLSPPTVQQPANHFAPTMMPYSSAVPVTNTLSPATASSLSSSSSTFGSSPPFSACPRNNQLHQPPAFIRRLSPEGQYFPGLSTLTSLTALPPPIQTSSSSHASSSSQRDEEESPRVSLASPNSSAAAASLSALFGSLDGHIPPDDDDDDQQDQEEYSDDEEE